MARRGLVLPIILVLTTYEIGETDDLGYHVVSDPVHTHDLQATVLHLLGMDHVLVEDWQAVKDGPPGHQLRWRSASLTVCLAVVA